VAVDGTGFMPAGYCRVMMHKAHSDSIGGVHRFKVRALALLTLLCLGGCVEILGGTPRSGKETVSLREVWKVEHGDHPRPGLIAVDERRLYSAAYSGVISARDRSTGIVLWSEKRPYSASNLLVVGERILLAGFFAAALDATTGEEIWSRELPASAGLATHAADGQAFYVGTRGKQIFAFDVASGSELWRLEIGPDWEYEGIVRGLSVSGDTVYAVAVRYRAENGYRTSSHVYAIDRYTGSVLWTFDEGGESGLHRFNTPPVIDRELLLLTDFEGNAYIALNRVTGVERWRRYGDMEGYLGPMDAPKVSGDTIFGGSADRYAVALHRETGQVLWTTRTAASIKRVAICGGRVLVNNQALGVLERATGRFLSEFWDQQKGEVFETSIAVDGRNAYVMSSHYAYAFECPE
jgi:outer membrane protein assembly factor BamB